MRSLFLGSAHCDVLEADIGDIAGHFRSDRESIPSAELAVDDRDIVRRNADRSPIRVLPAFDGDLVITDRDIRVLNEDIAARIRIDAVAVWAVIRDRHVLDENVVAEQKVRRPKWRVHQRQIGEHQMGDPHQVQ